jgi:hypothetical protein
VALSCCVAELCVTNYSFLPSLSRYRIIRAARYEPPRNLRRRVAAQYTTFPAVNHRSTARELQDSKGPKPPLPCDPCHRSRADDIILHIARSDKLLASIRRYPREMTVQSPSLSYKYQPVRRSSQSMRLCTLGL